MGNGWHEWPLVIFTVLGQCVVGALIVSGIGWFAAKNNADRQHIIRGMFLYPAYRLIRLASNTR